MTQKVNHELIFQHPAMSDDLIIYVKPNQIVWSYGLNTANYPTYGGEVIQILSMYVEDLNISGEVRSYNDIERIYKWFVTYMQKATQGRAANEGYDSRPIKMKYPHRNWEFSILPKSLPGFKYGTEVVAPTWQLTAAVSEFDDDFQDSVLSEQDFIGAAEIGGFDPFGTVTAEIGYQDENPWSAPTTKQYQKNDVTTWNNKIKDFYGKLLPSWLDQKDFSALERDTSIPKSMQQDPTGK
jgi:hypothetical protein